MKKIIAFLLLFAFGLSGCEKDDICDANTPTTPRLIISFYDINNPTVKKKVTRLKVTGVGAPEGIIFNESALEDEKYITSSDSIGIPLRTDLDTVTYNFILNYGNANASLVNTDVIKFDYSRQTAYVSRACGFKTIFQLNSQTPFTQTDPDGGLWMQDIDAINKNIEFEDETHLKVYF
ncbi:hypothetical protein AR687_17355 [Flavobacteriaceae bacterium CRH]|nr:hypothetical protein AR687_17355 [Flavobacteriaceae bacterium CRH]